MSDDDAAIYIAAHVDAALRPLGLKCADDDARRLVFTLATLVRFRRVMH
jgi:hypothetical protein